MTPAIHPQTNTLAMDTRMSMRARCNHSGIAMGRHSISCQSSRSKLTGVWRVPKTPFAWKAELGGVPDSAFSAQLGDVTYYAVTRSYGHPAYVDVHGMRGGLKRLVLGNYVKIDQAKQACERHYRGGCDLDTARESC